MYISLENPPADCFSGKPWENFLLRRGPDEGAISMFEKLRRVVSGWRLMEEDVV